MTQVNDRADIANIGGAAGRRPLRHGHVVFEFQSDVVLVAQIAEFAS